jgi:hypothetical protein
MMRSSEVSRLGPVEDAEDYYGRADPEPFDLADDELDADPLLPESELMIERLKNELESELAGADAYERGCLTCLDASIWLMITVQVRAEL